MRDEQDRRTPLGKRNASRRTGALPLDQASPAVTSSRTTIPSLLSQSLSARASGHDGSLGLDSAAIRRPRVDVVSEPRMYCPRPDSLLRLSTSARARRVSAPSSKVVGDSTCPRPVRGPGGRTADRSLETLGGDPNDKSVPADLNARPGIRLVIASQDLDEGRLPRTVVTDQRMDLSTPQPEVHIRQGALTGERLAQVLDSEGRDGCGCCRRRRGHLTSPGPRWEREWWMLQVRRTICHLPVDPQVLVVVRRRRPRPGALWAQCHAVGVSQSGGVVAVNVDSVVADPVVGFLDRTPDGLGHRQDLVAPVAPGRAGLWLPLERSRPRWTRTAPDRACRSRGCSRRSRRRIRSYDSSSSSRFGSVMACLQVNGRVPVRPTVTVGWRCERTATRPAVQLTCQSFLNWSS